MSATKKIPRKQLAAYFDAFTKRFLRDGSPEAVDVEVVAPDLGDQQPVQGARLLGITYDEDTSTLEFAFDVGDHRVLKPKEVWAVEEPDGFVSLIEIERAGRAREVVSVKKVGLRRLKRA
jgi:uncharacterized protein DUF5335